MSDDQAPSTALERAIRSQPDELERLLEAPLPHDRVERLKQAHRIWLVGTGTSQHAAELGATMLHDAGRAAHAMSSMHFVNWAPPVDPHDAVIVISHNAGAETSYASAAYTMGMMPGRVSRYPPRRGLPRLEITGNVAHVHRELHRCSSCSPPGPQLGGVSPRRARVPAPSGRDRRA
jgi:hypothetical protein